MQKIYPLWYYAAHFSGTEFSGCHWNGVNPFLIQNEVIFPTGLSNNPSL